MAIDVPRALAKIDEFLAANKTYEQASRAHGYGTDEYARAYSRAVELQTAIEKIAHAVEPSVAHDFSPGSVSQFGPTRDVALRIRGLLVQEEELEAILGPTGPALAAQGLHVWVWAPCSELWSNGHYREALQAAATQIELNLQAKLNRHDISGVTLVRQAFTSDPPQVGKPRLRFTQYEPGTESWTNAHEGAMNYAAGCVMAIRNLTTHALDTPAEGVALEQLASLSVLARMIADAEVTATPTNPAPL